MLVGLALAVGAPAASAHASSPPIGPAGRVGTDVPAPLPQIDAVAVSGGVLYVRNAEEPFSQVFDPATETLSLVAIPPGKRDALTPVSQSCLAEDPRICYWTVPGRLAIAESGDGGETWTVAWQVTEADRERIARSYSAVYDLGPGDFFISSLAVASSADGYVVLASAEYDGLVLRRADGTWERIGFADGRLPALDWDPRLWQPYPVVLAIGAFCLLLVAYTEARAARGRNRGLVAVSRSLLVAGLLLAMIVVSSNHVGANGDTQPDARFGESVLAFFALAATCTGAALRAALPGSRFPAVLGLATLGALAVWVATDLAPSPRPGETWWLPGTIAVFIVITCAIFGVRLLRRGEPVVP